VTAGVHKVIYAMLCGEKKKKGIIHVCKDSWY